MKKHDVGKFYYEYLAKFILETYASKLFKNLELSDRPDLRDKNNIGIEVTRTSVDNELYVGGIFESIKGKPLSEVPNDRLEKLDDLGYKVFVYRDLVAGYYPKEAYWVTIDALKKGFSEKLTKIKEYETEHTHLFIFSPWFDLYDYSDIEEFLSWALEEQKGYSKKYEFVFIYQGKVLYIVDMMNAVITEKALDQLKIHDCCVCAKECAEQLCK